MMLPVLFFVISFATMLDWVSLSSWVTSTDAVAPYALLIAALLAKLPTVLLIWLKMPIAGSMKPLLVMTISLARSFAWVKSMS